MESRIDFGIKVECCDRQFLQCIIEPKQTKYIIAE